MKLHPIGISAALLMLASFQPLTPQQRTLEIENEEVAVWKSVVVPNGPLTMHTHQHPRIIVALSGGTMKIVREDGTTESNVWETGKAYWLPASQGIGRHADLNTGSKPIEVIVVELKKAQ